MFSESVRTLGLARLNLCVGLMKDGVVLGADTRATSGDVVADKMCAKIHHIAPNI